MDKITLREYIIYLDKYKPNWRKNGIYRVSPLKLSYQTQLLANQTLTEEILWKHIGNRQLGVTFSRQRVILGYIVDFYSERYRLAIEIDGLMHDKHKDRVRDNALNNVGIYVLRFSNDDISNRLEYVLSRISGQIDKSKQLYIQRQEKKKAKAVTKRISY